MGRSSIIVCCISGRHHCLILPMSLLCVLVLVTSLPGRSQEAARVLAWVTCLELQSLVHWSGLFLLLWVPSGGSSASQLSLRTASAQILKWWPDFVTSVVEFLLGRIYVLSSDELSSHRPAAYIAKFYPFFWSIPISLETVFHLPAWSALSHLPPPPSLVPCPVYKCLQLLAGVACSHHSAIPWSDQVCSIFPNPGGLSSWYTHKPLLPSLTEWVRC